MFFCGNCGLLLLITIVSSPSVFSMEPPQESVRARVNEKCTRDHQCIKNAFCRVQQTCLCETNFAPTADKGMCIATAGLSCSNDTICSTMTNAQCRQGVCTCRDDFILDINNSSSCIRRPVASGDRCQRTEECVEAMELAQCINEKCRCLTSYHFVPEINKCIKSKALFQACLRDYDCFMEDRSSGKNISLQCINGECGCKGDADCNKGTLTTFSLLLGVSLWIFHLIY